MRISVPKEIKNHESRVGLTPSGAKELKHFGHEIFVESNAGLAVGFTDDDYQAVGAKIMPDSETTYSEYDRVVKVKEPQSNEKGQRLSRCSY